MLAVQPMCRKGAHSPWGSGAFIGWIADPKTVLNLLTKMPVLLQAQVEPGSSPTNGISKVLSANSAWQSACGEPVRQRPGCHRCCHYSLKMQCTWSSYRALYLRPGPPPEPLFNKSGVQPGEPARRSSQVNLMVSTRAWSSTTSDPSSALQECIQ